MKSKKARVDEASGNPVVLLVENVVGPEFDRTGALLRGGGHHVVHLTAFTAALDLLRSTRSVDVLIAATVLPGQPSGFTLARQAQRLRPGLPVIYLASTGARAAEAARALGPVLPHPLDGAALLREVDAALGKARE
jgi:CheY-like chemotaxis protein